MIEQHSPYIHYLADFLFRQIAHMPFCFVKLRTCSRAFSALRGRKHTKESLLIDLVDKVFYFFIFSDSNLELPRPNAQPRAGVIETVTARTYNAHRFAAKSFCNSTCTHSSTQMVPHPPAKPIHVVESNLRAAATKQEDIFSLSALAQLLADLGRSDEAASFFEKALDCKATNGSSCGETRGLAMGWYAALVEGNGSEGAAKAEKLYKGALEMNERDPLAMGNYAVFLHRIKRDHRVSIGGCARPCTVPPRCPPNTNDFVWQTCRVLTA